MGKTKIRNPIQRELREEVGKWRIRLVEPKHKRFKRLQPSKLLKTYYEKPEELEFGEDD